MEADGWSFSDGWNAADHEMFGACGGCPADYTSPCPTTGLSPTSFCGWMHNTAVGTMTKRLSGSGTLTLVVANALREMERATDAVVRVKLNGTEIRIQATEQETLTLQFQDNDELFIEETHAVIRINSLTFQYCGTTTELPAQTDVTTVTSNPDDDSEETKTKISPTGSPTGLNTNADPDTGAGNGDGTGVDNDKDWEDPATKVSTGGSNDEDAGDASGDGSSNNGSDGNSDANAEQSAVATSMGVYIGLIMGVLVVIGLSVGMVLVAGQLA
jgi:hypothetical protein